MDIKFYSEKIVSFLRRDLSRGAIFAISICFLLIFYFYQFYFKPPMNFPKGKIVHLEEGSSLSQVASYFESEHLVQSRNWLKNFVIVLSGDDGVIAGDYYFKEPVSVLSIARTITDPNYQMEPVKVTIPEGLTIQEMSKVYARELARFDSEVFLNLASTSEGYLFPDTYLISPIARPETIISIMKNNFEDKVEDLQNEIEENEYDLEDIITMASILELEGNSKESREIISGILWKRLEIGMPLQVDAAFLYINGKGSLELTIDDLKEDSPYNTYLYRGLPPTPIANPGLESILAALRPQSSPYLFYLSGFDGKFYYARTFEEHKKNKAFYLK